MKDKPITTTEREAAEVEMSKPHLVECMPIHEPPTPTVSRATHDAMAEPRYPYEPDYAVAPGRTLQECMELAKVTTGVLASKLCMSEQRLYVLLGGEAAITPRVAKVLAEIFEPTAEYWLRREANYRTTLARLEREKVEA